MKAWRIGLAAAGILLAAFGLFRLLSETAVPSLVVLAVWLGAALIVHDALLAPSVVGVGWLLRRHVPDRARRYLQLDLIMSALVTVIALPMIYLRDSQPEVKALLLRNYSANLLAINAGIALVTVLLYLLRVLRDRKARPMG